MAPRNLPGLGDQDGATASASAAAANDGAAANPLNHTSPENQEPPSNSDQGAEAANSTFNAIYASATSSEEIAQAVMGVQSLYGDTEGMLRFIDLSLIFSCRHSLLYASTFLEKLIAHIRPFEGIPQDALTAAHEAVDNNRQAVSVQNGLNWRIPAT